MPGSLSCAIKFQRISYRDNRRSTALGFLGKSRRIVENSRLPRFKWTDLFVTFTQTEHAAGAPRFNCGETRLCRSTLGPDASDLPANKSKTGVAWLRPLVNLSYFDLRIVSRRGVSNAPADFKLHRFRESETVLENLLTDNAPFDWIIIVPSIVPSFDRLDRLISVENVSRCGDYNFQKLARLVLSHLSKN